MRANALNRVRAFSIVVPAILLNQRQNVSQQVGAVQGQHAGQSGVGL